jgi:hypothetical protein
MDSFSMGELKKMKKLVLILATVFCLGLASQAVGAEPYRYYNPYYYTTPPGINATPELPPGYGRYYWYGPFRSPYRYGYKLPPHGGYGRVNPYAPRPHGRYDFNRRWFGFGWSY